MMFAGAAIRQFFVLRHGYKLGRNRHPIAYAAVGCAAIVGTLVWLKPAPASVATAASITTISGAAGASISGATSQNDYQKVAQIIENRCYQCHGSQVQMKNVRLDSPALVRQHAQSVYQQVVMLKIMPMNNSTGITDEERAQIKQWFEAGAKTE
jgi:uncharacterized membrane protein